MYEAHFGFDKKPFSLLPDPSFLYFSDKHSGALAMLEYGIMEQSGITVITGDIGAGKTTLVRHLLRRLKDNNMTIGLINNTHSSLGGFMGWFALAYDLDCEGLDNVGTYKKIQEFLVREYSESRRVVLFIDEAQNMKKSQLEEVRLLSNINSDDDLLLQVVLVGQPELREKLSSRGLVQMAQRVSTEYHLEPLKDTETLKYIRHRVSTVGGDKNTFDSTAMAAIYNYTGGVPRLINTICDQCLAYAYGKDVKTVSLQTVREVAQSKKIGGVNFHAFRENGLPVETKTVDPTSALDSREPETASDCSKET